MFGACDIGLVTAIWRASLVQSEALHTVRVMVREPAEANCVANVPADPVAGVPPFAAQVNEVTVPEVAREHTSGSPMRTVDGVQLKLVIAGAIGRGVEPVAAVGVATADPWTEIGCASVVHAPDSLHARTVIVQMPAFLNLVVNWAASPAMVVPSAAAQAQTVTGPSAIGVQTTASSTATDAGTHPAPASFGGTASFGLTEISDEEVTQSDPRHARRVIFRVPGVVKLTSNERVSPGLPGISSEVHSNRSASPANEGEHVRLSPTATVVAEQPRLTMDSAEAWGVGSGGSPCPGRSSPDAITPQSAPIPTTASAMGPPMSTGFQLRGVTTPAIFFGSRVVPESAARRASAVCGRLSGSFSNSHPTIGRASAGSAPRSGIVCMC